jgi:hypothetical protein
MKTIVMIAALGLVLTTAPAFAGGKNGLSIGAGAGLLVSTKNLLSSKTAVAANLGANVNIKGGILGALLGGGSSHGHGGHGHGHGCGC